MAHAARACIHVRRGKACRCACTADDVQTPCCGTTLLVMPLCELHQARIEGDVQAWPCIRRMKRMAKWPSHATSLQHSSSNRGSCAPRTITHKHPHALHACGTPHSEQQHARTLNINHLQPDPWCPWRRPGASTNGSHACESACMGLLPAPRPALSHKPAAVSSHSTRAPSTNNNTSCRPQQPHACRILTGRRILLTSPAACHAFLPA